MEMTSKEKVTDAYQVIRAEPPWRHESSSILHHRILPFATLAPWLNDVEFMNIYSKIRDYTLVDMYRCYELWEIAKQSIKIDGDILEVGVWRGGSGALLAEATKECNKRVFLADTFTGVVKAGVNDTLYKGGEHSDTSISLVSELISKLSLSNIKILEGIFPDQTKSLVDEKISMLHCDVDTYSSTKDIVEWCLPHMPIGATLVFDDYGFFGCEGVTVFCNQLKLRNDLLFMHNLNGHAVFVKIK